MSAEEVKETLYSKILILNETSWENKINKPQIDLWLKNFTEEQERIQILFLLSQFMYFGSRQMRELLVSLYRDLFKYPTVEEIRKANRDTTDIDFINLEFENRLKKTKFLGIGNPSESGCHLLYFFRQENRIAKTSFIHSHEIFQRLSGKLSVKDASIDHYVFIDDFCGSGSQAKGFYDDIIVDLKTLSPQVRIDYFMLFATASGKKYVKDNTGFDSVESVFTLNETFKCFDTSSRYFDNAPSIINRSSVKDICDKYGQILMESICRIEGVDPADIETTASDHKLGFGDGQLLIGFHHNTPDNTLPIIWYDEDEVPWFPIFKRYNKKYDE